MNDFLSCHNLRTTRNGVAEKHHPVIFTNNLEKIDKEASTAHLIREIFDDQTKSITDGLKLGVGRVYFRRCNVTTHKNITQNVSKQNIIPL